MSIAMQEATNLITRGVEKLVASVYEENTQGGYARGVVMEVAKLVGVDLTDGNPDGTWGVESMSRVVTEVYRLKRDSEYAVTRRSA